MHGLRAAAIWVVAATITGLMTGTAQAAIQPHATAAAPAGSLFNAVTPVRVLDTRSGTGTGGKIAPLGPGGQLSLDLSGQVPTGATAVVLNLTGVNPTAPTYITANPDYGQSPYYTPVSNLNLVAGEIRSNAVTVAVGADRVVVLSNFQGNVDLVADLAGYYAPGTGSGFVPQPPTRVLDTRNTGSLGAGGTAVLDFSGQLPASATAVTFNLTGLDATLNTYISVWPDGQNPPTVSSLNLAPGDTTPNLVTVALGNDHKVDLRNFQGSVDVVADLAGYYATGAGNPYYSLAPTRVLDTRNPSGASVNPLGPNTTRLEDLSRWLPASASAAVFNFTGTNTTAPTYVTAWPAGQNQPLASNLNLVTGQTAANLATVALGSGDQLDLYNFRGNVDLLIDLAGYFAPAATPCATNCVFAWGDNVYGELGNGTVGPGYNPAPAQVPGLSGLVQEAGTFGTSYALDSTGKVYAWGRNDLQQLGNGTSGGELPDPVAVSGLPSITAISAGEDGGYALDTAHRLWAWGDNADGELGDGNTNVSTVPVQVSLPASVVSMSGSAALLSDGTVWTWGSAQYGALGNGTDGTGCGAGGCYTATPVQVSDLTGVVALYGNYAVKSDGTVWAWGWNAEGELGLGTSGGSACYSNPKLANCVATTPVEVTALTGVSKIITGQVSYAIKPDGTVLAWGYNQNEQIGDGTPADCGASTPVNCYDSTPKAIANLTGFTDFATGGVFTEAVKSDGTVWVWGDSFFSGVAGGQISYDAPHQVPGISGASDVAAGANGVALALVPNP